MIDVISYCPDLEALRAELIAAHSPYITEGKFTVPMTPIRKVGDESITLLRVSDVALVEAVSGLQVLASAPAGGTAAFDVLFQDPEATAIYDRVYDQSPVTTTDEDGTEHTYTPPRIFGVFA